MSNDKVLTRRSIWRLLLSNTLRLTVGFALLPSVMHGQTTQSQSDELATLIAKIKSGDFHAGNVEMIAKANAVQAVPALEEQFGRATDYLTKGKIASALVRLGDRDDTYWNYLLQQATAVVDSNVPDTLYSESQGKAMTAGSSPELKAWAQTHNISVQTAGQDAVFEYPMKMEQLAEAGDPRGIPLLRRALQSRNYLLASWAAKGLAQIQDKNSIPLIIAACEKAPEGEGAVIAASLVYFDDPQAQSAFDKYVPKEYAKVFRDLRARQNRPFN
jgi:hypothetical protein